MQNLAVVYFPNINSNDINTLREKYDSNWNIIRPHITLIFPSSDFQEDQLLQHIEVIAKNLKAFPITLGGLIKSFDDYLFLLVKEGNKEIITLHDKLYSGIFAAHLRKDIPFIPHITLGSFRKDNNFNKDLFEKAFKEAEELNMNVNCTFDNLTIIRGDEVTPPKIIKTFKLI